MKQVIIHRDTIGRNQSLGTMMVLEDGRVLFSSHLLERGWRNNKKNVSCAPAGKYRLQLEYSPKFGIQLWEAYGIPNRSEIKFHVANFWNELNGCFAPGEARFDINRDGFKDMVNSGPKFKDFMNAMGKDMDATLLIVNNPK